MISEISVYTIVPSEIRNFRMTLTSSKINLQWDAPLYLNGIIQKYEVVLQVIKERNSNYSKNHLTTK